MTLEEYEKLREEKRKALSSAHSREERKVEIDEELAKMTVVKKADEEEAVFIKLVGGWVANWLRGH